jgi:cysteinyl-tRNA synthetase
LQLGGEKMSKSLGNIISIKDFLSKRDADVMRMLVLNGTYRAPLMFNDETLDAAQKNVERLKSGLRVAPVPEGASGLPAEAVSALAAQADSTKQAFTAAMDDDFNTAGALAAFFELVKAINTARDHGANDAQLLPAQNMLRTLTGVLGLRLQDKKGSADADGFINLLVEIRAEVRKQKLWTMSDQIRDRLKELGVMIEDGKEGTTWRWS